VGVFYRRYIVECSPDRTGSAARQESHRIVASAWEGSRGMKVAADPVHRLLAGSVLTGTRVAVVGDTTRRGVNRVISGMTHLPDSIAIEVFPISKGIG
jgi:hypothetical protein